MNQAHLKICNKSKLVINTNSTTFCETIANEIPSILIINQNTPIRKILCNYRKYDFK